MSVCLSVIREAAQNDKLSQSEVDALQKLIRRRAQELRAKDASLGDNDALRAAGEDFARHAEQRALVEKRNTLLSLNARMTILDTIRNVYSDDPARGIKAMLVGEQSGRKASRASAAAEGLALNNQYLTGMIADIARVDAGLALLKSGELDRDIASVLWRLNTEGAELTGLDPRAIGLGKAIHKWQEAARHNANKAGAWIGKLPGWIVSQSHDVNRIAADREGWKAAMLAHADIDRIMRESEFEGSVDDMLDGLWRNLASGLHLSSSTNAGPSKGLAGMARGLSQQRSVHFKSADDWFAYNAAFGGGNLREAVTAGLENSARATGLMRVWGPSHADTFSRVVNDLAAELQKKDPAKASKFAGTMKRYEKWYMREVDGTTNITGSAPVATWGAGVRVVQNVSALGGSALASVGDLAVMMAGAKYAGRNGFGMVADGLKNLFAGVTDSAEKLSLYADLGMAIESMASKFTTNRFSVDDGVPGALGTMQKAFFTLNLQNRWTDGMRASIAEFLSTNLARRAGDGWAKLPARLQTTLAAYGLDAGKWDILRTAGLDEIDGRTFLTPSAMRDVPDAPLKAYLDGKGVSSSAREIAKLREEIERQARLYFSDQNGYMLLAPDAATRGMMKMGTQRGTPEGEGLRMLMQFKSFMLAFSQRALGREMAQGGVMGVAGLVAWSALAGYAAMTLKDLAKGKVPRDPMDNPAKTAIASLQQGGGLGIYGDVLFSQVLERRGTDAVVQLFGPTASDVNELVKIAARAAEGRDPKAAGVRFVTSNAPFLNLFYTRLALDYAVFWNLQEAVNPGSLRRMEREMQERTGQEYLISPSRDRLQPENSP